MFDSTVELVSLATSNSLFAFWFCNLIIAMIFVVSSLSSGPDKSQVPNSMPTQRSYTDESPMYFREERAVAEQIQVLVPRPTGRRDTDETTFNNLREERVLEEQSRIFISMPDCKSNTDKAQLKIESPSGLGEQRAVVKPKGECPHCNIEIEDERCGDEEEDLQEDGGDDDELRRRIEDFIAKVNREWQAERLRAKAAS